MPPKKKANFGPVTHPIDVSGVLEAAKAGKWKVFESLLASQDYLTFEDFNELPPGRVFGVVHQIAYHGNAAALNQLLTCHPRVDCKLLTRDGKAVEAVAAEEGAGAAFLLALRALVARQDVQELVSLARDGEWVKFNSLHAAAAAAASSSSGPTGGLSAMINAVPAGRKWGVLHQVSYWGNIAVLTDLAAWHPTLNLELETNEADATQTPADIALGRGHTAYRAALQALLPQHAATAATAGSGATPSSSSASSSSSSSSSAAAAASATPAASSSMKVPVAAEGKLCNICYSDEHDAGSLGVACDEDHFLCQDCFTSYVSSECDTEGSPQVVVLNGGRVVCPQIKGNGCASHAYANKLIAMVRRVRELGFVMRNKLIAMV
mmetsp:Transcript_71647/g.135105  ORF Transcript_71647/g.135105 Transcript_71647/m.135105 type:complete len:379 (+) Transcript_71647:91-1227(+)